MKDEHRIVEIPAGAFHARDGWWWRRGEYGTVSILCADGCQIDLSADEWASVVAGVSAGGGSLAAFNRARTLHDQY